MSPSTSARPSQPEHADSAAHGWTVLSNHGRVLLLLARRPDLRLRDLAHQAGITERSASSIVSDLAASGYLTKVRDGRRNTYVVHPDRPFRHPAEADHAVGELITVFTEEANSEHE